MTGNEIEVAKIMKMDIFELLDYIMTTPEYLTDSYYTIFNMAINERYQEISKETKANG
jgi:hypothetical protein